MKPTCPICPGDRKLAKNGFNALSGTQRYRCTAKGCNFSLSDSPHTQGRPTKWGVAMTDADRQAEYRVREEEKRTIETINLEGTPMTTYPLASVIAAMKGDRVHVSMTSDDIEASESAGQKSMIAATQIPKDGDWDLLKSWGVVIIGDADELFYNAQLPEGWELRSNGHALNTDMIDNWGRKRAALFYKAAFYDRRAEVFAIRNRFIVEQNWAADYSRDVTQFAIKDEARNTVLEVGSPVRYAVLKSDPSIVGAVKDGVFYFDPTGGNLSFFTKQVPVDQATVLTADEFYKGYHSGDTWNHEVMDTLENLASEGLDENLLRFLAGHDEWDFA